MRIWRAASTRDCSMTSAADEAIGGLSASVHRPSFSIRIGDRLVSIAIEVREHRRR